MVLVCNWDDPSSADVDHMDFLNFCLFILPFYFFKEMAGLYRHVPCYRFYSTPFDVLGRTIRDIVCLWLWRLSGVKAYRG
jgi:hypothetical protein